MVEQFTAKLRQHLAYRRPALVHVIEGLSGDRALTLLHSVARLGPRTAAEVSGEDADAAGEISAEGKTAVQVGQWLRTSRRGLLAPPGVGTIDQVLAAVLPVRYNMLRLYGLSEKVFILDEAHAYGPWLHKLLIRLPEWLGGLRAPVVLLSATPTGRTAAPW